MEQTRSRNSYVGFQNRLISFIKPTENKTFSINDTLKIKLLNKLKVDFSL